MESSITIKVGDEEIILSNTEEYKDFLKDENVRFLRDPTNKRVGGFGSLVDGGTYTLGPAVQPPITTAAALRLDGKKRFEIWMFGYH